MELATPIGILVAVVSIALAFILEGGSPMVAFSNPAAILIIIGGTVGVSVMGVVLSVGIATRLLAAGLDPTTLSVESLLNPLGSEAATSDEP